VLQFFGNFGTLSGLLSGTNSHETNYAVDPPHVVSTSCQFLEMYLQIEGRSKEFNVSHIEELRRLYPCSQVIPALCYLLHKPCALLHAACVRCIIPALCYMLCVLDVFAVCRQKHVASSRPTSRGYEVVQSVLLLER